MIAANITSSVWLYKALVNRHNPLLQWLGSTNPELMKLPWSCPCVPTVALSCLKELLVIYIYYRLFKFFDTAKVVSRCTLRVRFSPQLDIVGKNWRRIRSIGVNLTSWNVLNLTSDAKQSWEPDANAYECYSTSNGLEVQFASYVAGKMALNHWNSFWYGCAPINMGFWNHSHYLKGATFGLKSTASQAWWAAALCPFWLRDRPCFAEAKMVL